MEHQKCQQTTPKDVTPMVFGWGPKLAVWIQSGVQKRAGELPTNQAANLLTRMI